MKRYIFLMILVMAGNVVEAMEPWFDLNFNSGRELDHNPLRLAIQDYPHDTTALKLLIKGADPNETDRIDTPLSNASSKEQIELMFSYGADPKKMKCSGLRAVITHYFCLKSHHKPSDVANEKWRNEAFEAMDLLLKHGESIKKREDGDRGLHLMNGIFMYYSLMCEDDLKPLLSFLIARGSNPNELSYLSFNSGMSSNDSAYQRCQNEFPELAQFMRKERGWYLIRPLLLMTHIFKKTDENGTEVWDYKQPSECAMRGLPKELVREIAKHLLHWSRD